ncbi:MULTISPECIES: restriction endonuclease [Streptomyces]|uniref:restriction endonuclease n=1 Tax=Streptomyces lycopersici TaxID=2974589 RepID=UPI0021CFB568|nr:restriction endonuclease [Streptomyces sp. NEAU-383]
MGGANDNGADVLGRLPDGRSMVIQCKRYAPTSTIASRELRDLLGARVHFGADLAVFVTTTGSAVRRRSSRYSTGSSPYTLTTSGRGTGEPP